MPDIRSRLVFKKSKTHKPNIRLKVQKLVLKGPQKEAFKKIPQEKKKT